MVDRRVDRIFVRVVEKGSFPSAARHLRVGRPRLRRLWHSLKIDSA